ncbi:M23 family metallopeptidase [Frigoribacterium sp. CG_9.8]|uniref:peptidoglycan DD-metalloendopeptidase family protein n=1 Tax=Frigoribacterium sp. CG_9.8 TaxID=2787733 RepID=UPI0018C8DF39|nr:M23 family metallopeptidase [Frigoribacterium sp. CG_9.8]MBG6108806.1 murein DD-endopeptidase MepM/ murein hydrolase activator NlpD [Frigoribacterium sp. CG_9.8]
MAFGSDGGLRVRSARGMRGRRSVALLALLAVLAAGSILSGSGTSAFAAEYPSWDDVQAARQNKDATQAEVTRVQGLLAGLQAAVDATQAVALNKGDEYQAAQQKYDEAAVKAAELLRQADAAQTKAAKSKQQAGQLAAQLSRSAGTDFSTRLFFSGGDSKAYLAQLGLQSMVKDQSAGIYEKAIQDQNTAQSLTDQADVAKAALKRLADIAQKALAEAITAAAAATSAFTEQSDNSARLKAQLATLTTNVDHLESEYVDGIKALWGELAGLGAGKISSTGWVRPSGGHISSPFGFRINPFTHAYAFHAGTDLAANCNSPIFAAHGGTVVYAGPNGGYGNFVQIDNGDGTTTGYGHIVNGGIHVSVGQPVGPGQPIAAVGSTGHSTGCHLHYEVRQGGNATDPVPFMRNNGIELAN